MWGIVLAMMWTPVTVVLFMIVIVVIVPYLHLMLYISNHITPHIRSNITLAVPDTSIVDIPVVEVTSPPSLHAWMAAIGPTIRGKLISDVVLPGTHSSASYSVDPNGQAVDSSFITTAMVNLGFKRQAARWLQTQAIDVLQQLEKGIRAVHFKVVAVNQHFFIYNGLTGEPLFSILQQIRKFVDSYKGEIVVVYLEDLKEVTFENQVKVMGQRTRMKLLDVISHVLRKDLVPFRHNLPTVGEIIEKNARVILVSDLCDPEDTVSVQNCSKTVWPALMAKTYKADLKPSDLFQLLSDLLERPITSHSTEQKMTFTFMTSSPSFYCEVTSFLHSRIFLCMSLSVSTITGYTVGCLIHSRLNGFNSTFYKTTSKLKRHLCVFSASLALFGLLYLVLQSIITSFGESGCLDALMEFGRHRNTESEVFPISNHIYNDDNDLLGLNSALTHWLSKPTLYKMNTIFVDDFQTSNVVQNAIDYNRGSLRRKMTVFFVGSPLLGSKKIRSWFACAAGQISYMVASHDEGRVVTWSSISPETRVTFEEGQYPMDSQVILFTGTPLGKWFQLYSGNLHQWIDRGHDLYIRASESRNGRGLAYISSTPELVSSKCIPDQEDMKEALNYTKWDSSVAAVSKNTNQIHIS